MGSKKQDKFSNSDTSDSESSSSHTSRKDNIDRKRINSDTENDSPKRKDKKRNYTQSPRNQRHTNTRRYHEDDKERRNIHKEDRSRRDNLDDSSGHSRYKKDYRDQRDDRRDRRDDRRDDRRRDNYRGNRRDDFRSYRHRDDKNDNSFQRNENYRRRRSRSRSFDHSNAKWGKDHNDNKNDKKVESNEKQKPNFGLSGKLTEETNTFKGVIVKYSEPPEARKAKRRWRLYPFKGEKALQTLYIHRESAYLIGRDRKIVDLPVDHPSCSKQHAALQYRLVPFTRDDGSTGKRVRPYLIDLESANGTYINNKRIESRKYVELLEKDVIKFGFSSREYVLLHENSKDETMDDDVKQEEEINLKQEIE